MRPPRLYWCICSDGSGFPSHDARVCMGCGEAVEVPGVKGDASIVSSGVWRWVREAIAWSLGISEGVAQKLAPGGAAARIKMDDVEAAYAIVYGGGVAGVLRFEWEVYRWVFSPRGWLASLVYREKLGNVGALSVHARRGDLVPWSVYRGERVEELGARLVARDVAGRIVVLRVEKMGLRVEWVEAYREDADYPRNASVELFAEMNWKGRVERMFEEAVAWLGRLLSEKGPGVVRLSGGKDSGVAAAVFAEAGGVAAVFTDTGWEHEATRRTARATANALNLSFEVAEPPRDCWELLEAYGPPGRDYRWCTQVCKLGPTSRLISERGYRVVVAGNRALESPQRAREGRLSRSRGAGGGELVASPLYEWSSLDVYAALYARRLPLNPVYEEGIERVGCFNCPSQSIPELLVSSRLSPGYWERWQAFLRRYAEERGLPEAWLRYHLWRWRYNPPPRVRTEARRLLGFRWEKHKEKLAVTRVLGIGVDVPSVRLHNPLGKHTSIDEVRLVAPALGPVWERTRSHIVVRPSRYSMATIYEDGEVYVEAPTWEEVMELAEDAARLVAMAAACTGCMACIRACPNDAIRVLEGRRPVVDEKSCIACRRCLRACPPASYSLLSQRIGLQKTIEALLEGEELD